MNSPDTQSEPTATRRIRFSLRALFVITALLCVVLSHIWTSYELQRLRRENHRLRDDLEFLSISDAEQLHAIAQKPDLGYTSKRWQWRLYYPKGRKFRVCYKFTELPVDQVPDDQYEFFDDVDGELRLTASVLPDVDGVWKLVLHTEYEDSHRTMTRTQVIANSDWLTNDTRMGWYQAGQHTTESVEIGEAMILLRVRPVKPIGTNNAFRSDPDPADGILLWIEEAISRPLQPAS